MDVGRAETLFNHWHEAEARYAEALAAFSNGGPPEVITRESAIELAMVRTRADSARDRFFREALHGVT